MWQYSRLLSPYLHAVGQLVVHPPSRIIAHSKDKMFSWPLCPPSRPSALVEESLSEIHFVIFYVSHLLPFYILVSKFISSISCPVHGAMDYRQKMFKLVWRCHHLLSCFLAKGHLPRLQHQSHLSVIGNGDNEMILVTVLRSPGICLMAKENLS